MGENAAPDPQVVGRVQKLAAEFRLSEEAHARAGRATSFEGMKFFNAGAEQAWNLAALAVDQAIHPTVAGSPPRQFASAVTKVLAVFDDAEKAAAEVLKASLPTLAQQIERKDGNDGQEETEATSASGGNGAP